jgi:hypothetical protein
MKRTIPMPGSKDGKAKVTDIRKARGSKIRTADVQSIGKELLAIKDKNGNVHPDDLLEQAKDPSSAMHSYITWNDKAAAYKQRINEANYIIRTMEYGIAHVRIVQGDDGPKEEYIETSVRMFHSVKNEDDGPGVRVYKEVAAVMKDKDTANSVYADCYRYLLGAFSRFSKFSELSGELGKVEEILLSMSSVLEMEEDEIKDQIKRIKRGV